MSQINVVIPSYDEYQNLQILVPQIINVLDTNKVDYIISIIDRVSSTDNTPNLAIDYEGKVKIINRYPSDSYGDAVRTGIAQCESQFIIFMDADGSHEPGFLIKLIEQKQNFDFVIASRYIDGGGSINGTILKLMSKIVNLSYRVILNIPAKDVSNSFKLYKTTLLKSLILTCKNFDIIEEIFFKCVRNNKNLKIIELPYYFKERMHGKTKRDLIKFSLSFLSTLIKLRFS